MKYDMILCGVGGQGVLSVASIIASAAVQAGLHVRQSEVHGMAQRGGAVLAHLRISDMHIHGDLVPQGGADMVLSMEPVEALRYVSWLSKDGAIVSAAEPFINIPNYPEIEKIYAAYEAFPRKALVHAEKIAKEAGLLKAVNMVMVGAASRWMPLDLALIEATVCEMFAKKDPAVIEANKKALVMGRSAGEGAGQ